MFEKGGSWMKKRAAVFAVILAVGVAAMLFYRFGNSRDEGMLMLSGTVEVTEVDAGFKVPGRIRTLYIEEGRFVKKSDKIAALDSAELESVVNQGRAAVQNAEAQYDKAKRDHERYKTLFAQGVISPQQMDAAKTASDVASSQLALSRAALRTAEVRLRDAVIFAPLSGVALRKNVEEGETVAAGVPVVTIGDLDKPWVKVYVKENQLGLVKLGQKVEVTVDSFPEKKYEGEITFISSDAEFTPKNVQTREERVKLVFGVKVSVKNENNELKPGMPADVMILLK
jgi:HlyD family secretion protein